MCCLPSWLAVSRKCHKPVRFHYSYNDRHQVAVGSMIFARASCVQYHPRRKTFIEVTAPKVLFPGLAAYMYVRLPFLAVQPI